VSPVSDDPAHESEEALVRVPGTITLFGYDPVDVELLLRPRSRRWRLLGTGRILAVTLVVAPLVGLAPPHAPWVVGVLGAGGFLARRRWRERFTVEGVEGPCPKCGAELSVASGALKRPHTVPCDACHHESSVRLDDARLDQAAAD